LIPDSFIQELLARVDVVDVVGRYVQLRKGGINLLGLCPFHQEKSPSFTVSPNKQFYHCFGCGAHGSAITFLMNHTGSSFPDTVQSLASSVGMQVPQNTASPATRQRAAQRKDEQSAHVKVLETAQTYFKAQLKKSPEAIAYLKSRGMTGEIAALYGLGWAPDDRQGLASAFTRYEDPLLVEAGLVIESDDGRRYDRFRARVMFPIRNTRGQIVGFGGRIIGRGEPKYLNSPETPVFNKGQELYGAWEARQAIRSDAQVVVVEGYMDVVGLAQLGIGNAVATLGTATTPDHMRKLIRLTDRIVFSFDGDAAGRRAAWRALQTSLPLLKDDLSVRFLFLPAGHDPDTYIREFGQAAFRACLKDSVSLSAFLMDELGNRHRLDEPEGRSACSHEGAPILAQLPAGAMRRQILNEFAQMVRLTPQELDGIIEQQPGPGVVATVYRSPAGVGPSESRAQDFGGTATKTTFNRRRTVAPLAKRLLSLLLAHPNLVESLGEQQLDVLESDPNLSLVREFIVLVQGTGARHLGALLEAADAQTDLAQVLTDLSADIMGQTDLPDPQSEWEDALGRIELDNLKRAQAALVVEGLDDPKAIAQYQELARRIHGLKRN
jgi:DNA primase